MAVRFSISPLRLWLAAAVLVPILLLAVSTKAYNTPECPTWPSENTWKTELGDRLSTNAALHGPISASKYTTECETLGMDAYAISKAGNGICMHFHECAAEFCAPELLSTVENLPLYVVEAKNPADVTAAIQFARAHDIQVTIKTTGHSYQGSSTARNSLLIWMQNFDKDGTIIQEFQDSCADTAALDYAVVSIGGGQVWNDVLDAVGDKYHMVTGAARTVSAAGGWLQGCGLSFSSRTYGIGIDQVAAFEVVLADGSQVVVDACSNSDLFWALRGGGGGTFGVVTNVKYRLHPVTPISLIFWGVDPTTAPSVEANLQFVKQWLE
jgi:hypothetical protein